MQVQHSGSQTAVFDQVDAILHSPEAVQTFIREQFDRTSEYRPSRAMRLCLKLITHIKIGQLDVILPDHRVLRFGGKADGPQALLRIHNDRFARRFMIGGQLAFCEAYLDGDWSSPDLAAFFELIQRNAGAMREQLLGGKLSRFIGFVGRALQRNSKRGAKKNIYQHYDIGNAFYGAWLDRSMTYSSAYFADGITDLEGAQLRKYEEMVRRLDLKKEHHVLEIGCGWGGFAEYAASTVGCKMTCITISQAQHDYAVQRIERVGLSDLVEIHLQDYRDVQGQFDRIASIEMFEAVGEAYWPTYFGTVKERLKAGGRAVLQIITIDDRDFEDYRKGADYIQRYIFPGGMLPSFKALSEQIEDAGLERGDHLSFGQDYARTLALWNERFQAKWPELNSGVLNERFKRLWEQYLAYCEAGFTVGSIDVIQIALDKK